MKKVLVMSVVFCLVAGFALADTAASTSPTPLSKSVQLTAAKPRSVTNDKSWKAMKNSACVKEAALTDLEMKVLDGSFSKFWSDPLCCSSDVVDRKSCLEEKGNGFQFITSIFSEKINVDLNLVYNNYLVSLGGANASAHNNATEDRCANQTIGTEDSQLEVDIKKYIAFVKCELDRFVIEDGTYYDSLSKLQKKE